MNRALKILACIILSGAYLVFVGILLSITTLMIDGMASNGGSRLGGGYERILAMLFYLSVVVSAFFTVFQLNFRTNTKMRIIFWLVFPLAVMVAGLILLSLLGLNIG